MVSIDPNGSFMKVKNSELTKYIVVLMVRESGEGTVFEKLIGTVIRNLGMGTGVRID